jgi:hypothetical protein
MTLARRRLSASACLDCLHHRLVEVNLLQLDIGDLDAPRVGLRIEDPAEIFCKHTETPGGISEIYL